MITDEEIAVAYAAEIKRAEEDYVCGRISMDPYKFDTYASDRAKAVANRLRHRRTTESWSAIRRRIYKRDKGECGVCGAAVSEGTWECGHIIDRMLGGTDLDDNLMVMCWSCNHTKPFTETREEFEQWRQGPHSSLYQRVYERMMGQGDD